MLNVFLTSFNKATKIQLQRLICFMQRYRFNSLSLSTLFQLYRTIQSLKIYSKLLSCNHTVMTFTLTVIIYSLRRSTMSNLDSLPYFSLGCVMEGLNQLFQCLFAVSLQHVQLSPGEAWTEDIYKLVSPNPMTVDICNIKFFFFFLYLKVIQTSCLHFVKSCKEHLFSLNLSYFKQVKRRNQIFLF